MKMKISIFVILFLATVFRAQDGSLDASFDTDGKVTTDIVNSNDDEGRGIGIQSDGKIIVAGNYYNITNDDFAIVRYKTDGTVDSSFGTNGRVRTQISSGTDKAFSVGIQSDGKILVAGFCSVSGYDFAVARYNGDGSLDTGFDTDGIVVTDLNNGGSDDRGYDVAIQSDGKIIVAGYSANANGDKDFALVRYNNDGSLDASFDSDGIITTDFSSGSEDYGMGVALQSDGKIVVAGNSSDDFAVARYNPDGSLDTTFNGTGVVTTDLAGKSDYGYAVAIQSDGKIVVAGTAFTGLVYNYAAVRYDTDGTLDSTFDGDGIVMTDIVGYDFGSDVVIQPDGKILVAGYSFDGSNYYFSAVRYNSDGSLDTGFDGDGKVTTTIGSKQDDRGFCIGLQSDGKIVVGGISKSDNDDYDFAVVRYNNPSTTTPVELISFAATTQGSKVTLNWQTATEVNNYGFQVERQKSKGESSWEEIGFIEGAGNSNSPKTYSFTDNVTESGRYSYRLKQIDIDGSYEYSKVVEVNVGTPSKFELSQNYPNPFFAESSGNSTTTIKYSIPSVIARSEATKQSHDFASNVQLNVYNILGEEVATLVNEKQSPGNYTVQFDASNLPSGVYFYTLRVGNFVATKKMILLK